MLQMSHMMFSYSMPLWKILKIHNTDYKQTHLHLHLHGHVDLVEWMFL